MELFLRCLWIGGGRICLAGAVALVLIGATAVVVGAAGADAAVLALPAVVAATLLVGGALLAFIAAVVHDAGEDH